MKLVTILFIPVKFTVDPTSTFTLSSSTFINKHYKDSYIR